MAMPFSYHWRNLFVRKTTTLLTVLVIAAVVGVFTWMLGFAAALDGSLSQARDETKVLVLKRGATAETSSAIPVDDYNKLNQLTDVARDPTTNDPLISPEMMVQISRPRVRDRGKTWGNIALRGVAPMAFKVHRNVKYAGPEFPSGAQEVIVGMSAHKQFDGLNIGDTLDLGYSGNRSYTVVGYFSADGGPAESEVWGYLPSLMNAYNRTMYSAASLRLKDGADPRKVLEQIEGPAIQLTAQTEAQYWRSQSANINTYLRITKVLVVVMCLAAVFSIANTMFSMVAGRTQEIAMLRTIGFSRGHILTGFVLESVCLSLWGGVVGCAACVGWLQVVGSTKDMFGASTFTTLAFEIRLTPMTVVWALASVVVVGVVGAWVPAMRAARIAVVTALREP
ncbi:MAG: FtsX-like permease family protein [Planctomycetota bacterium]